MQGRIIVSVTLYEPNVLCYGNRASTHLPEAVQKLIDMIPTTSDELLFGHAGQPAVQVGVPKVFISRFGLSNFVSISPPFLPPYPPLCLYICQPFPSSQAS